MDTESIKILEVISDQDLDMLLEHTRKLRETRQTIIILEDPSSIEKLGLENDEPQATTVPRKPDSKGLLAEREGNIDPEMPSLEEIRGSRRSGRGRDRRQVIVRTLD